VSERLRHLLYVSLELKACLLTCGSLPQAILLKSSMRASDYRPGFDVPYPLPPMGVFQVRHRANSSSRPLLLSFKGTCRHSRTKYAAWHDGAEVVIVCTDRLAPEAFDDENYHELALRSRFALTPAGNGLHSSRLMEAIFLGAIPVLAEAELLLPFCSIVQWEAFSVRVHAEEWHRLPSLLRAISPSKLREMQEALAEAREAFFENPMQTAVSLIAQRALVVRET